MTQNFTKNTIIIEKINFYYPKFTSVCKFDVYIYIASILLCVESLKLFKYLTKFVILAGLLAQRGN